MDDTLELELAFDVSGILTAPLEDSARLTGWDDLRSTLPPPPPLLPQFSLLTANLSILAIAISGSSATFDPHPDPTEAGFGEDTTLDEDVDEVDDALLALSVELVSSKLDGLLLLLTTVVGYGATVFISVVIDCEASEDDVKVVIPVPVPLLLLLVVVVVTALDPEDGDSACCANGG
uniref:Uncharacterized protein n=1 Tax=Anopheles culicifacies TaxID=139723 RepID=A0A182MI51_9DIPT